MIRREEEIEHPPPDTPCLMREINEAIARDELGVFHVDIDEPESEREEDQEGPHATKKEETKIDSKNKDTEDNLETVEDDMSDSDSTSTVEFTASELTERAQDPEHDEVVNEVIEIDTGEEENEEDDMEAAATGIDLVNDDTEHNKEQGYRGGQGNPDQENLVIDEDDETDEVVVITKATEEGTEDNAHNEVVEIDPDTETIYLEEDH